MDELDPAVEAIVRRAHDEICDDADCHRVEDGCGIACPKYEAAEGAVRAGRAPLEKRIAELEAELAKEKAAADEAWAKRRLYFHERNEEATRRIAELEAALDLLQGFTGVRALAVRPAIDREGAMEAIGLGVEDLSSRAKAEGAREEREACAKLMGAEAEKHRAAGEDAMEELVGYAEEYARQCCVDMAATIRARGKGGADG